MKFLCKDTVESLSYSMRGYVRTSCIQRERLEYVLTIIFNDGSNVTTKGFVNCQKRIECHISASCHVYCVAISVKGNMQIHKIGKVLSAGDTLVIPVP